MVTFSLVALEAKGAHAKVAKEAEFRDVKIAG